MTTRRMAAWSAAAAPCHGRDATPIETIDLVDATAITLKTTFRVKVPLPRALSRSGEVADVGKPASVYFTLSVR